MEEFEHLEYVQATYSQRGLHTLLFKTNTGRVLVSEGQAGPGPKSRELNLREHNKAIIGFRGLYSSHILDLYMYIALRLDIITETVEVRNSARRRSVVRQPAAVAIVDNDSLEDEI